MSLEKIEAREAAELAAGLPTAEEFIRLIARLDHTGDDGYTAPEDEDDAIHALDLLIATARDLVAAKALARHG